MNEQQTLTIQSSIAARIFAFIFRFASIPPYGLFLICLAVPLFVIGIILGASGQTNAGGTWLQLLITPSYLASGSMKSSFDGNDFAFSIGTWLFVFGIIPLILGLFRKKSSASEKSKLISKPLLITYTAIYLIVIALVSFMAEFRLFILVLAVSYFTGIGSYLIARLLLRASNWFASHES